MSRLSPSNWSYNILYGAAHSAVVNCADLDCLVGWIWEHLPRATGHIGLKGQLEQLATLLSQQPLQSLVKDDLKRIAAIVGTMDVPTPSEMVKRIRHMHGVAHKTFTKWGLVVPKVEIHVVDDFPRPYQGCPFWAMSLDQKDAADYGIEAGIYFKEKHLYPVVSELTLCHELMHAVLSLRASQELVRGLEDGLCDIFGLYACARVLPYELATSALLNLRFFPATTLDMVYLDHLRQAAALEQRLGFVGLLEVVKHVQRTGRQVLYTLEDAIIQAGQTWQLRHIVREPKQDHARSAEIEGFCFKVLAQPVAYVLSPEAICLRRYLRPGDSVKDLERRVGMSSQAIRAALKELSEGFYLVLMDGDVVISNECPRYIVANAFRYKCDRERSKTILSR
jgi:hypothetical protein